MKFVTIVREYFSKNETSLETIGLTCDQIDYCFFVKLKGVLISKEVFLYPKMKI